MTWLVSTFFHANLIGFALSFAPGMITIYQSSRINGLTSSAGKALAMSSLSDAEDLLRKARALREQAETEETNLHASLVNKKKRENEEIDHLIDQIFPTGNSKTDVHERAKRVAQVIENLRISAPQLEKVVERLNEREISAKGLEHVEPSISNTQVKFERVSSVDEKELARVQGLIQILIDAAAIIDQKALEKTENLRHNVMKTHWCSGNLSKTLSEKAHFLCREHDEQFKSRVQEYYEAARKKDRSDDVGDHTTMFP